MLGYLQRHFYRDSRRMLEILDTLGIELDGVWFTFDDILDQCFIDRATWGLDIWEEELALKTNPNDSYEVRRSRIKAKLIGTGTFTKQNILNLANAFSRKKNAKYLPLYEQYAFQLIYEIGDLISYGDLKAAFERVKPAHLALLVYIVAHFEIHNSIRQVSRLRLHCRVPFFGGRPWYLDGLQQLDGRVSLIGWTGERQRNRQRLEIRTSRHIENRQTGIVKARQNYWPLDGSVTLDGSRLLSSQEKIIEV
ncbi:MAG: putative phage tail protein [Paenibacillus macerans]|nr:putative phage tail protein [Paenibacillus macerans]MDU7473633.1 putative phage tail protein [Paenibacillus macerans]MEC0139217.1 DUF2313 domain-containing protein [Paenibacillus macerans]UMV47298.1 YmfQ family protein [Paenibacillus macerans]